MYQAYCRGGKVDAAESIFLSMNQKGILANTHLCASLLAACTENHLRLGNFVVDYVYKHKIQANATIYTAMMSIRDRRGRDFYKDEGFEDSRL